LIWSADRKGMGVPSDVLMNATLQSAGRRRRIVEFIFAWAAVLVALIPAVLAAIALLQQEVLTTTFAAITTLFTRVAPIVARLEPARYGAWTAAGDGPLSRILRNLSRNNAEALRGTQGYCEAHADQYPTL
jgi:hypothetical protein